MDFTNFKIIPNYNTGKIDLFLAGAGEIEACEKALDISFEKDYKEYVSVYGNGILGGSHIRVYLPSRILVIQDEWKIRIDRSWCWQEGKSILSKSQVLKSVLIGDTIDGEEIIWYEDFYYIFPANGGAVYRAGKSLCEVVKLLSSPEIQTKQFRKMDFEPVAPE